MDNKSSYHLPWQAYLLAIVTASIAFFAYFSTLHPGIGPSLDSIELQIAALVRGVIHPPGSPQYLLLGSAFTRLLTAGDPAYRLNLFSALSGALAVGLIGLTAFRLTKNTLISVFTALMLAFGVRLWYQASIAELYALNAFWIALVLYLLISYSETGLKGYFWAATVAYALSFGNHTSMLMLLPAYLFLVLRVDAKYFLKFRTLLLTATIVLIAAAQYLYIPLRVSAGTPFCNYCPESGSSLLDYLTGGPFKAWFFTLPPAELFARLPQSMGLLARQFQPWGLFLIAIGLWELLREKKTTGIFFLLAIFFEYVFVMTYVIPDWHDFMTPVYVLSAIPLSWGLKAVGTQIRPALNRLHFLPARLHPYLLAVGVWLLVSYSVIVNYDSVDQSADRDFAIRSQALLAQVGPDAVILMPRPGSPALYYSWAVRYTAFTDPATYAVPLITPPEIDPPPGPAPYYLRWEDVAEDYSFRSLNENRPEVYLLDWADSRAAGWGLVAICSPETGAVAGYRLVSIHEGDLVMPLVDDESWAMLEPLVTYEGGEMGCWPEG